MKYIFTTILLLGLIITSCNNAPEIKGFGIKEMTAKEFKQHYDGGSVQVIDVRTPSEFSNGHIKGAININVNDAQFSSKLDDLDKNGLYLMHCQVGGRSARAFKIFQSKGFKNVGHMTNGLVEWLNEGYKVEK